MLGTGKADKNDCNDARSVAIAALRSPGLRVVQPADHAEVLRLLAKRNQDIGDLRTKLVCRLHAVIASLDRRVELPRNSTLLTPMGCSERSSRPPRSSTSATNWRWNSLRTSVASMSN